MVAPPHGHRRALGPQALAAAGGARLLAHEAGVPAAHLVRLGLVVAATGGIDGALEFPLALPLPPLALGLPGHRDAAVENRLLAFFRQITPGRVHVVAEHLNDLLQHFIRPAGPLLAQFAESAHPPVVQALVRIDEPVGVELDPRAQAVAFGAHAQRRVEAEHLRRQLGEAEVAIRAGVPLREQPVVASVASITPGDRHQTLARPQGRLDRIGEAGHEAVPFLSIPVHGDDQPIHHQRHVVFLVLVQLDPLAIQQFPHLAVHPHAGVAVGAGLGEYVLESALAVAGQRGQHLEARARRQRCHALHDLLRRLSAHLAPTLRTVGRADAGEEHPQIIVDLGHRAHRRTRVLAHRLLLDGNGRAQAADEVHLGLLHLADELPGVGRKRLDVAPLPLGVEGVEGQAGLAAAGDAGDDHQLEARQAHVNVLQVVFLGTTDENLFRKHTMTSQHRISR